MYLCYIDESGTPEIPGTSSHYVLAGISTPIWHWRTCDNEIHEIKRKYNLEEAEIHTGWMLRPYLEQNKIPDFEKLSYVERRSKVSSLRTARLLDLQKTRNSKKLNQTKKNYRKTHSYMHLTYAERETVLHELADCVGNWGFARLFGECIDKIHFDPDRAPKTAAEQAFEGMVSRFDRYLSAINSDPNRKIYGLLIHDNNDTVAKKLTRLTKQFHQHGTLWTAGTSIIETPLFVDSELTSMVQIADLCSYSIRRYLENGETELFDRIFPRVDKRYGIVVGLRHFTKEGCECDICTTHKNTK